MLRWRDGVKMERECLDGGTMLRCMDSVKMEGQC